MSPTFISKRIISHWCHLSNFHLVPDTEVVLQISLIIIGFPEIQCYFSVFRSIHFPPKNRHLWIWRQRNPIFFSSPSYYSSKRSPKQTTSFCPKSSRKRISIKQFLQRVKPACEADRCGALLSAWAKQGNRETTWITIYTLNNKHISSTLDSLLLAQYLK